ncbi:hypothetical protein HG530_006062 [Fusarium avenaceum]|nr:hypothetical protein HG530_006062 [Fusarium avenaceum]
MRRNVTTYSKHVTTNHSNDTAQERSQGARSHREPHYSWINRFGKHGLSDKQNDQKKLLCEEKPRRLLKLEPRKLIDRELNLDTVLPLDLIRLAKQQSNKRTNGLERDENKEDRVGNLSSLVAVGVETKVDSTAEDLARETVGQPVAEGFTTVPRLWICNGDGSLGHPEDSG